MERNCKQTMISCGHKRPPRGGARRGALAERATAAYLCFVLLGLPLAVNDGYYDITETKHLYFLAVSAVYLAVQFFCLLPGFARRKRRGSAAGGTDAAGIAEPWNTAGTSELGAVEAGFDDSKMAERGAAAKADDTSEARSLAGAVGAAAGDTEYGDAWHVAGTTVAAGTGADRAEAGLAAENAECGDARRVARATCAAGAGSNRAEAGLAAENAECGNTRCVAWATYAAGAGSNRAEADAAAEDAWAAGYADLQGGTPRQPASRARLSAADCCMLAFLLLFALSGALSARFSETLIGQYNRYQGLITAFAYAAVYFAVSRRFRFTYAGFLALVTGFAIVCAVAMLNDLSVDPLQIRAELSRLDRVRYISTVGNLDFYGSVLAVLFPAVLAFFCYAETPARSIPAGVALLLGAYGMLLSGSESFVLAFIAALLLFPLFLIGQPRPLRRFPITVIALLAAMHLAYFLHLRLGGELYVSYFMRGLLRPAVSVTIALICLLALLFTKKLKNAKTVRRAYALALAALLLAGAVFLVLANTLLADRSFGSLDRFVKWNADWGTERGRIWAYSLDAYRSFFPLAKLFGGGPGCLYRYDLPHPLFSDAVLDTAHNEYLQYLLTIGAAGLAAYLGLLLTAAVSALRRAEREPLALGCFVGVAAYAVQAAVNIAQPFSTPFLFVFLGILAALRREGQK